MVTLLKWLLHHHQPYVTPHWILYMWATVGVAVANQYHWRVTWDHHLTRPVNSWVGHYQGYQVISTILQHIVIMWFTTARHSGDNALNSSQGSASLSAKLQSRPPSRVSRPHSHVSRSYSKMSRRPTTTCTKIDQWDNSSPGDILELNGYHGSTSQLSICAHCDHAFTTAGLRVPLLLLCGHTYCTNCVEKACSTYPSAIRCGQCRTNTPVDQQGAAHMMQNEALLEVLHNKELQQSLLPVQHRGRESCAECERQPASLYCTNCSAAFCAPCSHKSHAGSKVRGKHTPVPITQRPQPNPTCKRHPGQTCMLYCETEGVPMCVLCKFYGQHRYHKYELLSKVSIELLIMWVYLWYHVIIMHHGDVIILCYRQGDSVEVWLHLPDSLLRAY